LEVAVDRVAAVDSSGLVQVKEDQARMVELDGTVGEVRSQ